MTRNIVSNKSAWPKLFSAGWNRQQNCMKFIAILVSTGVYTSCTALVHYNHTVITFHLRYRRITEILKRDQQ